MIHYMFLTATYCKALDTVFFELQTITFSCNSKNQIPSI